MLEATARKPGNVHPGASFADLAYDDFVAAAKTVAPILAQTPATGVGQAVLSAMQTTRAACDSNPNLGIVLLIAPLAAVPDDLPLVAGIGSVLGRLTVEDAALVYQAIRIAQPGGLGQVDQQDVSADPDVTLLEAMRLAADRDLVATQYADGFSVVLETGLSLLADSADFESDWETAVIRLHIELMSRHPDSLISRKCGRKEAVESARRAKKVLEAGWPHTTAGHHTLQKLDDWLRAKGNARNPGTTADLVTASLFAALREGIVQAPSPELILARAQQIRSQS